MKKYATKLESALVTTSIFLWPVAAFAVEGEGHGFPWVHWVVSLVNFAIFLGVLVYFAGGRVQSFFHNRREILLADLNEAKRLREEAQAKLDEYSNRLNSLEKERKALMDEYHAQGEREKQRLVEEAKRQVEKMGVDAELVIQQEVRKAVAALEAQAVDLALGMAEKSLRTKLDERSQNVLVDRYVGDLKSMEG